jgi:hypothetical protein
LNLPALVAQDEAAVHLISRGQMAWKENKRQKYADGGTVYRVQ